MVAGFGELREAALWVLSGFLSNLKALSLALSGDLLAGSLLLSVVRAGRGFNLEENDMSLHSISRKIITPKEWASSFGVTVEIPAGMERRSLMPSVNGNRLLNPRFDQVSLSRRLEAFYASPLRLGRTNERGRKKTCRRAAHSGASSR